MPKQEDRYLRQIALPEVGEEGQRRLDAAHVAVVGCGALGSNVAEVLARAGVGRILLVDFDVVEFSNLQRQALLTEEDVGQPKARAVAAALRRINSHLTIDYETMRIEVGNVEQLIKGADLVLDGLDNLFTRYLVNDACVKHRIPWVFAAVAGTFGMTMSILPGEGPCLRCLSPQPAPEEMVLTAGNAGLLNTVPRAIVALQVTLGIRILLRQPLLPVRLFTADLWEGSFTSQQIVNDPRCPCCGVGEYSFLAGQGSA